MSSGAMHRTDSWPPASPPKQTRPLSRDHRVRSAAQEPMLYLRPPRFARPPLQFFAFDAEYIEGLCAGDLRREEHFVGYFTELLHLKLRSRLQSRQAVEDVRQEVFARVLATLRKENGLRQPERLGAFVNTVCNNVLFEHYRANSRSESLDEEDRPELPATGATAHDLAAAKQLGEQVRDILTGMPPRDRAVLKAIFLDEKDREDVCREFGVDGEYLRVLLFRAKQNFKAEYLKRMGGSPDAARR